MSLIKLKLTMLGTLALIIGVSTLFFTFLLSLMGVGNLFAIMSLVILFNLVQWLIAPYIINAMYHVQEIKESEMPWLYSITRRICEKARMEMPKLMLAKIPIPNAFAYGSPLTGRMVAVTEGLIKELEEEEVEAVIGHELGHLKHRDVQIMMFASVLPAIFYYIGYSLMLSSWFNNRREAGQLFIIGAIAMAIYWILSLLVLALSRLREYYADSFSVRYVTDGARKLSEALAKIVLSSGKLVARGYDTKSVSAFKALFISDPDRVHDINVIYKASSDRALVEKVLSRPVTLTDRILELFSTHPNIVKRLRALQKFTS
ncbi:Protease HtpX [archaeon HR06]|nr:Protease HtpX [archaeon HR06]